MLLVGAASSERINVIAQIIERYVAEHPRAADTVEGIRSWWLGGQQYADPFDDVQKALDLLVTAGRLRRSVLPDGVAIYSAQTSPED
jgi:hypothetical protein